MQDSLGRRGTEGGEGCAVFRRRQQTAAALHAAGLCSGDTLGTGPHPTVALLCQHGFAPVSSRFPTSQGRPTCFVVFSHLADICVRVTAVTAGVVGCGCLRGGLGRGAGSSHGHFRLTRFAYRLRGNCLWCLGCSWGPGES